MKKLAAQVARQPYLIFLIDGIGAGLSALLLVALVTPFESLFGIPRNVAWALAIPACLFAVYSLCCYFFQPKNYRAFLLVIIAANIIYCAVSMDVLFYYWQQLKPLGVAYFMGEALVILLLVRLEWMLLKNRTPLPEI